MDRFRSVTRAFSNLAAIPPVFQITFPDINQIAIIDAGTGIRNLGRDLLAMGHVQEQSVMALTHFHWDHIQGFPFFSPAYDPKQKLTILTLGEEQKVSDLREVFETQMQSVYFPVQLNYMGADFRFVQIGRATEHLREMNNAATTITAQKLNHPGGSYGFRIERQGKVLVICTDVEHGDKIDPNVVALAKDADLLVHDAQYTAEELDNRRGWGHSTYDQAMQVAAMAGAKRLAMTHHDPNHDDEFLIRMEKLCQERFKECVVAKERDGAGNVAHAMVRAGVRRAEGCDPNLGPDLRAMVLLSPKLDAPRP